MNFSKKQRSCFNNIGGKRSFSRVTFKRFLKTGFMISLEIKFQEENILFGFHKKVENFFNYPKSAADGVNRKYAPFQNRSLPFHYVQHSDILHSLLKAAKGNPVNSVKQTSLRLRLDLNQSMNSSAG